MQYYITQCIAGFIAFDENLDIVNYKLFKDDEIVSKLIKIEENEILDEEIELIQDLMKGEVFENREISVETTKRRSQYKTIEHYENIKIEIPNKGGEYLRENLRSVFIEIGFIDDVNKGVENIDLIEEDEIKDEKCNLENRFINSNKKITEIYEKLANEKLKQASQEEDRLLIQAINSIDDIDESISKLVERMRDWYSVYFPELDVVSNNETYIKLIAENENREDILKNHASSLNIDLEYSNGADIDSSDLIMIKSFSESIYSLQNSRKDLENYIDKKMEEIAPNLRDLLGSTLGAKLIAHIGSIKRLATYPASTIQIMGAEKAVFRHLKTGERPPKHGLIFQHPSVRSAKWWNRGKIARNLALKITFAVRKDVFTKEYDANIAKEFQEKVEQIEKENPFPKKTNRKKEREMQKEKDKRNKGKGKKKNKHKRKKNKKNKNKKRK